jgi:hypothetical protein
MTNTFWLHWIHLGLMWGVATLASLRLWRRRAGTLSVRFCRIVWVILGQASGFYVGSKTWAVLPVAAGAAGLSTRELQVTEPPAMRRPLFETRLAWAAS